MATTGTSLAADGSRTPGVPFALVGRRSKWILLVERADGRGLMKKAFIRSAILLTLGCTALFADAVIADLSAVQSGPITVKSSASALNVHWKANTSRNWIEASSLDSANPLITPLSPLWRLTKHS